MKLINKKIVITGGLGFIGSNIARTLAETNDLYLIDNLSTGKLENIKDIKDKNNITFLKGDIKDIDFLKKNLKDMDFVFHQAAVASVPKSIKDPFSTNENNITGTLNVLQAARENNVKKVIMASSCAIYGNPIELPITENFKNNPLSPYSLSKLVDEYYCKLYTDLFDLKTACLRYFNVYGPYQDPNGEYAAVIPKFIISLINDKKPIIYGDGKQTRDFIFVKDVVRANIFAAENNITGIYNIGSGFQTTINDLLDKIINISEKDISPDFVNKRKGDIKYSYADISKIKNKGFNLNYSLDEGLKITYDWFNKNPI